MAIGHPLFWFRSEYNEARGGDAFENKRYSLLFRAMIGREMLYSIWSGCLVRAKPPNKPEGCS